jgi:hypothetical protein
MLALAPYLREAAPFVVAERRPSCDERRFGDDERRLR